MYVFLLVGTQAKNWDDAFGKSSEVIPSRILPTNRIILQRYRSHRIVLPNSTINMIAGMIADEAVMIWKKARVPTVSRDDYIKRVVKTIDMWNNKNRTPEFRKNLQF